MYADKVARGARHHAGNLALRLGLSLALVAVGLGMNAVTGTAGETTKASGTEASPDVVSLRSQLGIIYAQNGHLDSARQEFVKLLEVPQGRAAALTNLGNLAFIAGDVDEAVESYEQASALDDQDAGILLNLGLAFKTQGKTEEADKVFAHAVDMAGGPEKAAYLLGLSMGDDTSRGKVSKMTKDEMRQMLAKAQTQVPETGTQAQKPADKPKVASRPGGARAGVDVLSVYWKDK